MTELFGLNILHQLKLFNFLSDSCSYRLLRLIGEISEGVQFLISISSNLFVAIKLLQ